MDRTINSRGLLISSLLLDAVIAAIFLFMPRSGMEEMAAAFVLLPLCALRLALALAALIRAVRRRDRLLAAYTVAALLLLTWFWAVGANLKPTYRPLHQVLRSEAKVQGQRFAAGIKKAIYDFRRARQRLADPDHAQLCDALTVAQDLAALTRLPAEQLNTPCATYYGESAPPLLHLMLHSYGPWTGGELLRPEADETFVAPAAERLLVAGADPDLQDANGNTALHYALIFQNDALLDALLAHGACVLIPNVLGESPLSTHSTARLRRAVEAAANDPDMLRRCPNAVSAEDAGSQPGEATGEADYQLLQALRSGRLERAIAALEQGADPNARDHEGTSFEAALRNCRDSSLTMTQLLLDAGADLEVQNRKGETPLLIALKTCSNAVPFLLERGADPTRSDRRGNAPLHELGRLTPEALPPLLDQLLAAGADINQQNRAGQTPLIRALYGAAASAGLVELLLERGADPDRSTRNGSTPLHLLAARKDDTQALHNLKLLLEANAALELRDRRRETPLITAVLRGDPEAVRHLLDAGANVQVKRQRGAPLIGALISCDQTKLAKLKLLLKAGAAFDEGVPHGALPLARAFLNKQFLDCLAPARLLLAAGADPAQRDQNGTAAIHSLAFWTEQDPAEALALLARYDAEIDARNGQGLTTLLLAARSGTSIRTLERLLESGADPSARDDKGNTLLHCAAMNDQPGALERLTWVLAQGGDPKATNLAGRTPLYYARRSGNQALVERLSAL